MELTKHYSINFKSTSKNIQIIRVGCQCIWGLCNRHRIYAYGYPWLSECWV